MPKIAELCFQYYDLQKRGDKVQMTENEIYNFTAAGLVPHPAKNDHLTCAFCRIKRPGQERRLIEFGTCDSIRNHFSILSHMVGKCFDFN